MPKRGLRIGGLTVNPDELNPRSLVSPWKIRGLHRPRQFEAGRFDFTDVEYLRKQGMQLGLFPDYRGDFPWIVWAERYRPRTATDDQLYVTDYNERVKQLDSDPQARKKARELLFSMLSPDQLRQVERNHYFDVTLTPPYFREQVEQGHSHRLSSLTFRIHRDRGVCGNIVFNGTATLCIHPIVPHPTDDILLSQKLLMESDPDEFIQTGNTNVGGMTVDFGQMFNRRKPRKPADIILPFSKDPWVQLVQEGPIILKQREIEKALAALRAQIDGGN